MSEKNKIGERIKKRRRSLGITQSALAGDKITRNMLSLIENDLATPSLETAKYIADELNVPLAYLFYDEDNLPLFEKLKVLPKIKECFASGKYSRCMDLIDKLSCYDDELCYMYAFSAFREAKRLVFRGSLTSAGKLLEQAMAKSQQTIYDTDAIEAGVLLYTSVVNNIQSPLLELDSAKFEQIYKNASDYEFFKYITLDSSYNYKNNFYARHLEAKTVAKKNNYYEALRLLCAIENEAKNSDEYNACLLFGVYSDLESCYKNIGDFENAYRYSSKRISLMEAFKQ